MNQVEQASSYQALLQSGAENEPYVFENLFDDSSFGARRRSKKRLKLLKNIDPRLREILDDDERVLFLTNGMRNSIVEALIVGWVVYYLNLYALVVTTKRLVLLQVDRNGRPKEFIKQLNFKAIKKVKAGFFSGATVITQDGKSIVFARVPKKDAARLHEFLDEAKTDNAPMQLIEEKLGEKDVCPGCFKEVGGSSGSCGNCGQLFKSPAKVALLSLLFPGFGDFYIGHRVFAFFESLVAAVIWASILIPDPNAPLTGEELAVLAGSVFLFLHGIDSAVTYLVARKGLYPKKGGNPHPGQSMA